ncbi:MAG TPA: hypothetical protein VE713_14345, partial [Pyrinomonadaceae bacterium]|nr:hypothetical protein [Pyrinomonadaceae bacterium]
MATKNLDAYKLGVVLDASGAAKGVTALKDADKAATKLDSNLSKLAKGFKVGIADAFEKELKAAEKMAAGGRVSALGNQLGSMVGQGLQNGICSVFTASNLGKLIGTAIAPGIGTVVGSVIGSGVDAALEKISGPLMNQIQRGIELNKQLEIAQLHYTTFTGNQAEAKAHLQDLLKLAKDAAIDPGVILQADQRLEEFNHDVKLSRLELQAAADASARFFGTVSVDGLNTYANALGLIAEKGELTSKTLMKLQRMNVNAPKYLSEALGLSPKKVNELIKANRIRGDMAARIISAGVEIESGGYAQSVAATTTEGRERRFGVLQQLLDQRATANVTGAVGEMYSLANWMLSSGAADKFVTFIDHAAGSLINLVESTVKTGVDVTGGVFKGMLDPASLISGASNYVAKFIEALRSPAGFDSHSPAQAMIPIGEDAGRGVIVGFEGYMAGEGTQRVTAAVTGMTQRARAEALLQNPNVQAFLGVIRRSELGAGEKNPYGRAFGNLGHRDPATLDVNGSNWPGAQVFSPTLHRYVSTHAFGAYQFEPGTYRRFAKSLGLNDVLPHSQDLAAVADLMAHPGALRSILGG